MESEFIDWLRHHLPPRPDVTIGPGDDAAVLQIASSGQAVITTDLLTEGVDFLIEQCDARLIGRKAMAVNLSDLAAMAARPVAALVSLALPRHNADTIGRQLFLGIADLAAEYEVAIIGGDTNTWDGALVVSITAIGRTTDRGPLRRQGARAGDCILVTGWFGGSILGKHLSFQPRVREALLLNEQFELHAGIDVSDGLSLDLDRMARESGCGAAINLAQIPIAPAAHRLEAVRSGRETALEHALADGEDFELILAVPPPAAARLLAAQPLDIPLTQIGYMTSKPGLSQLSADGSFGPLEPRGYLH